ncbi:bifunctional indole-3-glycerol phosphate synthase/phosphoribosylanthranilate isomerase, partial [Buchnera aphidicola]|nr:bifunctional indole-3-glycerol phosphate synthase/phosphoribosylanthranilate isomerase [Buchnera aphidicola]
VNLYIFDSCYAGTNQSFNWSLLDNQKLNKIILAGGININNCMKASKLNCFGLDFNSGVENQPGIKNHDKIKSIFKKLRCFL